VTPPDLRMSARSLAHLTRYLERSCDRAGVSLAQYRLLSYIDSAERRAGELAQQAAVSRPALTLAVDRLAQRGLVDRARLPNDRRGIAVRLTTKGRTALQEADQVLGELLATIVPEDELEGVMHAALVMGQGMARTFGDEGALQPALETAAGHVVDNETNRWGGPEPPLWKW
jgi:DNA-binding MarR family transcriptional regulator